MNEYLICKVPDEQGKISFVVFDEDSMSVSEYDIAEITQKIVHREIYNAKLENSVVKITDSKHALHMKRESTLLHSILSISTSHPLIR